MADFSATSILPPKDWQAFERKSRLLFEFSLRDPQTQNNGRGGQPQHGVDIFGRRGGPGGQYVGVQCKGKDNEYGKAVTDRELRREVKKSEAFVPAIREFILITTAPDDARIQEAARVLEAEVRSSGRDLSVAVWGWGRLQHEISRYSEAIREFHADASPFTDELLHATRDLRKLVEDRTDSQALTLAANQRELLQAIESLKPKFALEVSAGVDGIEKHLNEEIDSYRDLIRDEKPKTAIHLLTKLKDRVQTTASARVRFRITSNLGVAYHKLGEYGQAAKLLTEASELDPEDPIGKANKIAALLLKGKHDEAHLLAVASLAKHPENVHIAVQRLLAVSADETVENLWNKLPTSVRTAPEPYINRIVSLREAGDDRWREAAVEGLAAHPTDWRLQTIHAEAVLERLSKYDAVAIGAAGPAVPTQAELESASDVLVSSWKRTLTPESKPQGAFAHNAALAKMIVGQLEPAAKLLEEAEAHGYTSDEAKFMRVVIYRRQRRIDDAIRVADTLPDTPRNLIVRAELRVQSAPEKARDILAKRDAFLEKPEIIGSALTVIEAFCEQKDLAHALEEAERLRAALPDDPNAPLAIFRIKQEGGDPEAAQAIDDALAKVGPNTDLPTRFLVCETLANVGRHKDVADLLEPVTSPRFDSPALRLLLAAENKADRRAALGQLLNQIPSEVLDRPYYRRIKIGHAFSTGDLVAAERQLRELLHIKPRDLELQLQLMHALFRQNKENELRAEARRSPNDFEGSPEQTVAFARFKKEFGDWREAHDLAYRTLLVNQQNEYVNRAYAAMFLFERRPTPIDVAPAFVGVNMAAGVRREDGNITPYIVEPDPGLRPTNTYLSPEHPLAKLMLGKSVGAHLEFPDTSAAQIIWIKPKELHALHVVLEEFNNVFPDAVGLEKVRVDPSSPTGLQPVLDRVRERHDTISSVASKYDEGMLPLSFVARLLGSDPVSTVLGLASSGNRIRVCDGTEFERRKALRSIAANSRRGCVVDAITFHFVRRLRLEQAVEAVCGPIGLVERSVSFTQQKIHELEASLDKPSMTVFYQDGQYFREEITPEQKNAALAIQRADRAWIAEHAQVIPAEGTKDLSAHSDKLLEALGESFFDEVRAAAGSGRILLSEDLPIRTLAEAEYGVQGCWLQVVLMVAVDRGQVTFREYVDAVLELIGANEEFISLTTDLLVYLLKSANGHSLPSGYCKAVSRLGGQKADLPSHVSLALGVVGRTWFDISLSPTLRFAIVGSLLENLILGRQRGELDLIIQSFDDLAVSINSTALRRYLRDWRRGHFL